MRKSPAFTISELLIVLAVLAILISLGMYYCRGFQDEANQTRAQGDLRVLKIGVEAYYKNHVRYLTAATAGTTAWENILREQFPMILDRYAYDPFAATNTTQYVFATDTDNTATAKYYVIYSRGISGSGTAAVSTGGGVTASGGAIWTSKGREEILYMA